MSCHINKFAHSAAPVSNCCCCCHDDDDDDDVSDGAVDNGEGFFKKNLLLSRTGLAIYAPTTNLLTVNPKPQHDGASFSPELDQIVVVELSFEMGSVTIQKFSNLDVGKGRNSHAPDQNGFVQPVLEDNVRVSPAAHHDDASTIHKSDRKEGRGSIPNSFVFFRHRSNNTSDIDNGIIGGIVEKNRLNRGSQKQ